MSGSENVSRHVNDISLLLCHVQEHCITCTTNYLEMSNFAKSSTLHLVNVIVNIRLVYFYRSGLYVTCQT